jgi:hypothetical protein
MPAGAAGHLEDSRAAAVHLHLSWAAAADQPQAPPSLRAALTAITRHVDDYASRAHLPRAA